MKTNIIYYYLHFCFLLFYIFKLYEYNNCLLVCCICSVLQSANWNATTSLVCGRNDTMWWKILKSNAGFWKLYTELYTQESFYGNYAQICMNVNVSLSLWYTSIWIMSFVWAHTYTYVCIGIQLVWAFITLESCTKISFLKANGLLFVYICNMLLQSIIVHLTVVCITLNYRGRYKVI